MSAWECGSPGTPTEGRWRFTAASSPDVVVECDIQPGHGGDMHTGMDAGRRVWWLRDLVTEDR